MNSCCKDYNVCDLYLVPDTYKANIYLKIKNACLHYGCKLTKYTCYPLNGSVKPLIDFGN